MERLINVFMASILTHNIALTYILGMCPLIAISKKFKNSQRYGCICCCCYYDYRNHQLAYI